jgi:hypothetical protein
VDPDPDAVDPYGTVPNYLASWIIFTIYQRLKGISKKVQYFIIFYGFKYGTYLTTQALFNGHNNIQIQKKY